MTTGVSSSTPAMSIISLGFSQLRHEIRQAIQTREHAGRSDIGTAIF